MTHPFLRAWTRPWILGVLCALVVGACTSPATPVAGSPSALPSVARPPATAPPAGAIPGRIAYEGPGGLWVMNADGTDRRQVTHEGGDVHFDPSWSPDVRRMVFRISSPTDDVPDPDGIGLDSIGVVDVATGRTTLVQPPQGGLFPDWSPRGNRILLSTIDGGRHAYDGGRHPRDGVHTMRPDGSDLVALSRRVGECGEWSPDGTRILFCSHSGNGDFETWVMDADGSHARPLTESDGKDQGAIWSPDGRHIAFSSTRDGDVDLWVMDADGSNQHRLLRWPNTNETPDAWLPEGIVVASFVPDAALPSWFLVAPDGSNVRSLRQLRAVPDPIDWIQP